MGLEIKNIGLFNSKAKHIVQCLTKDEANYISRFDSRESNFHGLPKCHKSAIIKEAILIYKSHYSKNSIYIAIN